MQVKKIFLFYAAFIMAILDLISRVHLKLFVIRQTRYSKYFTFSSRFWCLMFNNTYTYYCTRTYYVL